jgi:predicted transcriptional regulator
MMSNKLEKLDLENLKNDIAWKSLFETYHILDEINDKGIYKISAKDINEKREARLMTKFDHYAQLPEIFKNNDLTIQPDSRGTYVIGRFDSYQELPKENNYKKASLDIQAFPFPENIQTLKPKNIRSEATALLCAYNAEIISDLLGQEVRFTVAGRMSTEKFSYSINSSKQKTSYQINVDNSQCEIDGGFEGDDVFAIIEVKNSSVDNFLIRQLFYPYKLWINKTSKKVIPIFLSYFDNIFSFYVYEFKDNENYNSIALVKQKRYYIGSNDIELQEIIDIRETIKIKPENQKIQFPQADVFGRIVDILFQIHSNDIFSSKDIAITYGFDLRQGQYYSSAAMYLGLIERVHINKKRGYSLTKLGSKVIKQNNRERNLIFVNLILENKVFNKALDVYMHQKGNLDKENIIDIMKSSDIQLVKKSQDTVSRRADTVRGWINWILRLTQPSQEELPW